MSVCRQCGHQLGIGRFCTNCGHPVDTPVDTPVDSPVDLSSDAGSDPPRDSPDDPGWRTGTAERPALPTEPVPTPMPPPVGPVTESARYPLYADEVAPTQASPVVAPSPTPAAAPQSHRARIPWLPWAVGAVVLLLVVAIGGWLLFGGDDGASTSTVATESDAAGSEGSGSSPDGNQSNDLTRQTTATVPATAPPNQDTSGNLVNYEARNMFDGVPETCWRMPGDGSGDVITLQLPEPTTVTSVGLINGYAKTARDGGATLNWYTGNRRITAVDWTFDDGTTVSQDLQETRAVQSIEVDPVETSSIELRLVEVSAPGTGPSARNYTAISDIALIGTAS